MRAIGPVIAMSIVCLGGDAFADPAADAKVHVERATELHSRGNYGDAAGELAIAYSLDPAPDMLFALGQLAAKTNRCARAIQYYKRFLASKPEAAAAAAANEAIDSCKSAADAAPEPDHVAAATAAHSAGKYADAETELVIAYSLDAKPDLLYALGQVHVQRSQCPQAIAYYERFLAAQSDGAPAEQAKEAIQKCRTNPQGVAEAKPAPLDLPAPKDQGRASEPFYKDIIGDALVGGGIACAAAGGFMYMQALAKLDDAEKAPTYPEQQALVDSAHQKRTLALVLGGGGVALIGSGLVKYMLHGRESAGSVAIVPTGRGSFVTWSRRF
jgi:tetratricopeptide (TPR) repeat protein